LTQEIPEMTTTQQNDIRGVLIAVARARLLLPNATIAEVLSFAPPSPVEGAPDWLLGRMRWRGWELPLIAFSRMADIAPEAGGLGSKVVVLKALGGDPKSPYFAILTQGFPRLVTVSPDRLQHEADENLPQGVHARVWLNEDEAFIPDLEAIEVLIAGALTQAQAA
jgi:chemosensory pili system protein ChpC